MPPNILSETKNEDVTKEEVSREKIVPFKAEWVWINIFAMANLHFAAFYGFYLLLTGEVKLYTILFAIALSYLSILSVTAGCHRLWTHRTYKAKWPLRLFLATANMFAGQNHIFEWCRDHRVHHKFTDSDADPHNYKRGFFFAHMGWLMCKKHPDVKSKGQTVDMSDLLNDPIVAFQMKIYNRNLLYVFLFVIPTIIPVYFWDESIISALTMSVTRYILTLNLTWLVNSAAHSFGYKSYDKSITPTENSFLIASGIGEGFHNYHHSFPWDYSASEFGRLFNITTAFIDLMEWFGLAYDCRTANNESIKRQKHIAGDSDHPWYVIGPLN